PPNLRRDPESTQHREEFAATFWPVWPNKVGKPAAEKAFLKARRASDLPAIMAGLDRYVATKPPDRPWLNPATFLNQERFNAEPPAIAAARVSGGSDRSGWTNLNRKLNGIGDNGERSFQDRGEPAEPAAAVQPGALPGGPGSAERPRHVGFDF